MRATCTLCGNTSSFDEESLKGSTIEINGEPVVMCVHCEEEALIKLAKRIGIDVFLHENGELYALMIPHGVEVVKQLKIKK